MSATLHGINTTPLPAVRSVARADPPFSALMEAKYLSILTGKWICQQSKRYLSDVWFVITEKSPFHHMILKRIKFQNKYWTTRAKTLGNMTASRKALYISMRNNDDIIKDIFQLRSKSETIEVFNNKIPFIIDRVESKQNKVEKTMICPAFSAPPFLLSRKTFTLNLPESKYVLEFFTFISFNKK